MKLATIGLLLCCIASSYAASVLRIVGGHDAPDGKYPYQVSIWDVEDKKHHCGGSIINRSWILTAAHCLQPHIGWEEKYVIIAGTNSLQKNSSLSRRIYKVKKFFVHDDSFNTKINDIGLIQLEENIEFNNKVQPIRLSKEPLKKKIDTAVATGWGRSSVGYGDMLQEIDLKIIPTKNCEMEWKNHKRDWDSRICTSTELKSGICYGDSGGPLVADEQLVGIANFGKPNCGTGKPDVFARVSSYVKWINETITDNG